jgi:hypothetical protein
MAQVSVVHPRAASFDRASPWHGLRALYACAMCASRARARAGAVLLLFSLGCAPEREVLSSLPGAGSGNDSGRGTGATAGSQGQGGGGSTGEGCSGDGECLHTTVCVDGECVTCESLLSVCSAECEPPSFMTVSQRNGCPVCSCEPPTSCTKNPDCPLGSVCRQDYCTPCQNVDTSCPACPPGTEPYVVFRNGCTVCECAPSSTCGSDADCPGGMICYAGQACAEGCNDDPLCCRGNLCALPGCGSTELLDCQLVGCPDGAFCQSDCNMPTSCYCDGTTSEWWCQRNCPKSTCASAP